ncbi:IPT/TIG domain-containing protein [Actinomadura atramentaria]|uniref:IPT/TIG domain-containing protein n=1 Tax=Actinomadura atramentaria TaxID=1990 RepID=UPI000376B2FB|nr:IPT/TIG domain-containing protein [Actinomadura atramentaria]
MPKTSNTSPTTDDTTSTAPGKGDPTTDGKSAPTDTKVNKTATPADSPSQPVQPADKLSDLTDETPDDRDANKAKPAEANPDAVAAAPGTGDAGGSSSGGAGGVSPYVGINDPEYASWTAQKADKDGSQIGVPELTRRPGQVIEDGRQPDVDALYGDWGVINGQFDGTQYLNNLFLHPKGKPDELIGHPGAPKIKVLFPATANPSGGTWLEVRGKDFSQIRKVTVDGIELRSTDGNTDQADEGYAAFRRISGVSVAIKVPRDKDYTPTDWEADPSATPYSKKAKIKIETAYGASNEIEFTYLEAAPIPVKGGIKDAIGYSAPVFAPDLAPLAASAPAVENEVVYPVTAKDPFAVLNGGVGDEREIGGMTRATEQLRADGIPELLDDGAEGGK